MEAANGIAWSGPGLPPIVLPRRLRDIAIDRESIEKNWEPTIDAAVRLIRTADLTKLRVQLEDECVRTERAVAGNRSSPPVRSRRPPSPRGAKVKNDGKWFHVWQIIQDEKAVKACGKDQKIANKHNTVCNGRIKKGTCEQIDAKKVAQIRYEYTHPNRHRKQNHSKRP
jgi:hypothetical protein